MAVMNRSGRNGRMR